MASYDNGLISVSRDKDGNLVNSGALFGIEGNIGAYGTKTWRRSRLGLDYQGLYRHYNQNTFYNGSDHLLALDYATQVSRRSGITFRTVAGTSSRAVGGLLSSGAVLDPTLLGIPSYDIFDNRSYFLQSDASYLMQMGARNSFSVTGGGFEVRRQSKALVGVNGYKAGADFTRRVTRNTTVGANYQYFHVDYPRVFGEADVQGVSILFSRRIARVWDLTLSGGFSHLDFTGVRQVTVDPIVAQLLGITTSREAFNTINNVPNIVAQLARSFRRSVLNFNYTRGVSPGNGALLLSRQEMGTASYTHNSGQNWAISGFGTYSQTTGTSVYSGNFKMASFGSSVSYRFWDDFHFTGGVEYRDLSSSTGFARNGARITGGVAYSPGTIPFSFH